MAESSRHCLDAVRLRARGENGTSGEIRAYSDAGASMPVSICLLGIR
ncbi:MAG: hypothetical protein K9L59_10540 [Desulfobacterales bacterium]|nr:hypothetical protein [Desulfobacterales bacterium]